MRNQLQYLALGDSYTIGESVRVIDNFPYQLVQKLRSKGCPFSAPEVLAKTGWTTGELMEAMDAYSFLDHYDLVTLLIGVNNQYRGLDINDYAADFEKLLERSIAFANNDPSAVVVLSIPDYSCTPFASALDREKIRREVDAFNAIAKGIAEKYTVAFINITESTRRAAEQPALVAADGLHPSAEEYRSWAEQVLFHIGKEEKYRC
jgi:lysophospholipase L1-like esterase